MLQLMGEYHSPIKLTHMSLAKPPHKGQEFLLRTLCLEVYRPDTKGSCREEVRPLELFLHPFMHL